MISKNRQHVFIFSDIYSEIFRPLRVIIRLKHDKTLTNIHNCIYVQLWLTAYFSIVDPSLFHWTVITKIHFHNVERNVRPCHVNKQYLPLLHRSPYRHGLRLHIRILDEKSDMLHTAQIWTSRQYILRFGH